MSKFMSLHENDMMLEMAMVRLEEHIEKGDYESCLFLIQGLEEEGFGSQGAQMREVLRSTPLEKFAIKSPFV